MIKAAGNISDKSLRVFTRLLIFTGVKVSNLIKCPLAQTDKKSAHQNGGHCSSQNGNQEEAKRRYMLWSVSEFGFSAFLQALGVGCFAAELEAPMQW